MRRIKRLMDLTKLCSDIEDDRVSPEGGFERFAEENPGIGDDELEGVLEKLCFTTTYPLGIDQKIQILSSPRNAANPKLASWAKFLGTIDKLENSSGAFKFNIVTFRPKCSTCKCHCRPRRRGRGACG